MTVIADPHKLRSLAQRLRVSGQEIEQLQRQALSALQSSCWEGSERQRFESELSRDLKAAAAIGRKLQTDYVTTLERKAKALDDFQR